MKKLSASLLAIGLFTSVWAGEITLFAPDVRWDDQVHSWLGFCNSDHRDIELTMTGYGEDGQALGTESFTLQGKNRRELSADNLFDGQGVAWVEVTATLNLSVYVRYQNADGSGASFLPLNRGEGGSAWISQPNILEGVYQPTNVVINTGESTEGATARPAVTLGTELIRLARFPTGIGRLAGPFAKTTIDYTDTVQSNERLSWDELTGNGATRLAAVQHFTDPTGANRDLASLTMPRTPYNKLLFSTRQGRKLGWDRILLINTHPGNLPLVVTAFNIWGQMQEELIELEGYEKRVLDLQDRDIFGLPSNVDWLTVEPFERGLLGIHLFGSGSGRTLSATEGRYQPASTHVIPFAPYSVLWETEVSLINLADQNARLWVYGFDDQGNRYSSKRVSLKELEKKLYTTKELFAENASRITWLRVHNTSGEVAVQALAKRRDGNGAAAIAATPIEARFGEVFFADFEHYPRTNLIAQGWRPLIFSNPDRFPPSPHFDEALYQNNLIIPIPGRFYSEHVLGPKQGQFHVGYKSIYEDSLFRFRENRLPDSVAFMSPFIEVPEYGPFHLSFFMRFLNPYDVTPQSRFGLVWREEGTKEWTWFGIDGETLLLPNVFISYTFDRIQYRHQIVVASEWAPYQTLLPESLAGKRIQVGFYYHFVPREENNEAPIVFVDRIRIAAESEPSYLNFGELGTGTFISEVEEPILDSRD